MRTIKQLLMMVALLLCSVAVSAHDFEVDGIYYNIISTYDLTAAVTYKGGTPDSFSNEYTGRVVIPSTVTYKSKTLSVTSISGEAFYGCNLESISIPSSVTSIENEAFKSCCLENLRIEDGTETLFLGCNYDASYYSQLGQGLFYDSNYTLKTLYLGRNLSYKADECYGYSPFYKLKKLVSVTIGNGVTSIERYAFEGCSGLTSVAIHNSVTSIKYYAFRDCSGLTSVTIPNSVTSIEYYAFEGCSGLTSVAIPNSVTSIGDCVFWGCSGLTSVAIPNSVTSIGGHAFCHCSGLTSVAIPNSVTSIGDGGFFNCSALASVTIGNSVTSIGKNAFWDCKSLTSIYLLGTAPPAVGNNNFTNSQYMNLTVYVPKGSLATYQSADVWKNFWDIQELPYANKIILNKQNITTTVNSGYKLQATVYPENTIDTTIIWTSSNESIVKVSEYGEITGVSVGEATIKASCGSVFALCEVKVEIENFIKAQPTIESLRVELNTTEEDVKYQWYRLSKLSKEITPSSSGDYAWTESNGVWTSGNKEGVWEHASTMTATIDVQIGDTISFDFTTPKNNSNYSQWFSFSVDGKMALHINGGKGSSGHYDFPINGYVFDKYLNGIPSATIKFECVRCMDVGCATVSNIRHIINRGVIITGAISSILDESLFKKGNIVYCVVTLPNGKTLISDKIDTGTTNIVNVNSDTEKNEIYNLRGLRITDTDGLPRGIYIINGKKTFVK